MGLTIIHINRNIIQSNNKHSTRKPVCRVEDAKGTVVYCMEVDIQGPSKMIYRPEAPRKCGAKLWVETNAPCVLIGKED